MSDGAKSVLNALRARPFGATAAKLGQLAGISYSQTLRCLAVLEQRGWVEKAKTTIQHGYELRPTTIWSLTWSDGCMAALAFLRDLPTRALQDCRALRGFASGVRADLLDGEIARRATA
ncbi:MAG: helix-turn-helix domain-containing protein [Acidimicrobiaceae bacterium]|nr:helix-turn-helix domain-containing protein [Acidimicrobiaceae bacterium]MDE0497289.1 helix-turn-helix domain-containing protein [Acidimicrobiaceae bacterium]